MNVSILEDEDFEENFISLWSGLKLKQTSFSDIADLNGSHSIWFFLRLKIKML